MKPPLSASYTTLDEFAECGNYWDHPEATAIHDELWSLHMSERPPGEGDDDGRVNYNISSPNNLAKNWDRLKPSTQRVIFDALKDEEFDELPMPTDEPHDHGDNPGGASGKVEDDPNW